ncbi:CRE-SRSX-8 protein [Caenorhabditis remanei]|uniref:CRE-SRSX-8 protein n=1 Tax=Caenorhabditis remanei TaxID=31234 RepID=E3LK59_CAERE|nr:CRE-SRSX-8 protein [Caenorhabditis remanei]
MYRWNQILIASHKSFFICFGIFGNIHLVFIILSTPSFRSKSSYLQCIQSTAHIFCIMNSFIDVYLMITDTEILRETCFHIIVPNIFCYCVQSSIMVFILLDILFIVMFPIAHRNFSDWKYVTAMAMIPFLWGGFIVIWGFQGEDYSSLHLCSSFMALQRPIRKVLAPVTVASNTLSLLIFLILILVFKKKGQTSTESYKIMRHLKVSAALFIFSNYFSAFAINFVILLGYSGEDLSNIIGNISMSSMFSYSHTFYTIIWRSADYRKRFIGLYCKSVSPQNTFFVHSPGKNRAASDF